MTSLTIPTNQPTQERKDKATSRLVANTTLDQITTVDPLSLAYIAARNYAYLPVKDNKGGGVEFQVTISPNQKHVIRIELDFNDSYIISKFHIRKGGLDCVLRSQLHNVYAEQLCETILDMCSIH